MQSPDTVLNVPRARPPVHPYAQIAAHYRRRIKANQPGPGEKFLSIGEIAKEWGVSTPTAQRAINLLKTEGYLRSEHGRGTFVVDHPPP